MFGKDQLNMPRLETPTSRLMYEHYRRNGVAYGWKLQRAERLAAMLGLTMFELGRLCAIFSAPAKHSDLRCPHTRPLTQSYVEMGHFPPYIGLHFAFLESWALRQKGLQGDMDIMPVNLIKFGEIGETAAEKVL
jgi:hypothetical protein